MNPKEALKALFATAVAGAGALVVALGTGATSIADLDLKTWLIAALAVLGSGGIVYFTENGPTAPIFKSIISLLTAGIGSLVIALDDNVITQAEWLTAFSAAAVATGLVYQVSNAPKVPPA